MFCSAHSNIHGGGSPIEAFAKFGVPHGHNKARTNKDRPTKTSRVGTPQQAHDLIVEDLEDDDAGLIARKSPEKAKSAVAGDSGDDESPKSPRYGRRRVRRGKRHGAKRRQSATAIQDSVIAAWKIENRSEQQAEQEHSNYLASSKILASSTAVQDSVIATWKIENHSEQKAEQQRPNYLALRKTPAMPDIALNHGVVVQKFEAIQEVNYVKEDQAEYRLMATKESSTPEYELKDDTDTEASVADINTADEPISEEVQRYNEKMLSRYRGIYGKVSPFDLIPVMGDDGRQVQIGHGKHGILKLCRFFGKLVVEKTLVVDEGK